MTTTEESIGQQLEVEALRAEVAGLRRQLEEHVDAQADDGCQRLGAQP